MLTFLSRVYNFFSLFRLEDVKLSRDHSVDRQKDRNNSNYGMLQSEALVESVLSGFERSARKNH